MKTAFLSFFMLLLSFICFFVFFINAQCSQMPEALQTDSFTVILDAGHGGEDGGACAEDGTVEKDINLLFTENISLYFELFGIDYIPVRESDAQIGETSLATIRERKVSDIRKRMELVNSTPGSLLLSIHQNFYISEKYSGTQVFFAPGVPDSEVLAQYIQDSVVSLLQPDNTRKIKPTEGSVYLLDKAVRPSVMVECGFLSNERERTMLKDGKYRNKLSYAVVRGLLSFLYTEKEQ